MGKRELVALLNLSSWCLVMVEQLFLVVPQGCLLFVIVVFPDHTHLLFLVENILGTILWNYFKFGPAVQEMSFKDISYQELWRPFGLAEKTMCNFCKRPLSGTILWNYFVFEPVVQMSYKDILSWALATPLFDQANRLCNFGRSHHEEQFCEIILNLNQLFRRCLFKDYSYLKLWRSFFSGAEQLVQFL